MSFFRRLLAGHHGGGHGASRGGHRGAGHGAEGGGLACGQCRALNPSAARFCQQCAASLVPLGCVQCGASLAAGARFCGQCGRASG
ncbi:double zinc ribbon domain-containing protein [Pseudomonas sp. Au-Pse12]|uniref:double zinc ribbon domain-containing protein n=1 Tax=Pseudomonas sp. Au-Pse12 TaxID=2906459 RepID=UPI001E4C6692|nr:zinc ribbon domain-containing protein [Pseudomonas sp. Au-Pse12]MCE4057040.1 zinc ribbon domain-containing protein [Pseudomonas sp. Au-Pse12]